MAFRCVSLDHQGIRIYVVSLPQERRLLNVDIKNYGIYWRMVSLEDCCTSIRILCTKEGLQLITILCIILSKHKASLWINARLGV